MNRKEFWLKVAEDTLVKAQEDAGLEEFRKGMAEIAAGFTRLTGISVDGREEETCRCRSLKDVAERVPKGDSVDISEQKIGFLWCLTEIRNSVETGEFGDAYREAVNLQHGMRLLAALLDNRIEAEKVSRLEDGIASCTRFMEALSLPGSKDARRKAFSELEDSLRECI